MKADRQLASAMEKLGKLHRKCPEEVKTAVRKFNSELVRDLLAGGV